MTEVHYPQCGKYPVACPNDCDVYMIKRQKLDSHLKEQCPLEVVDCPFHFAGCETQLLCKDMPEHTKEMSTGNPGWFVNCCISSFRAPTSCRSSWFSFTSFCVAVASNVKCVDFHVKQTDEEVNLPPFYTHPCGYRMCVHVYPMDLEMERELMFQFSYS